MCSAVADETGDRLATIDMGQKEEGCCVPFLGHSRKSEAAEIAVNVSYTLLFTTR